MAGKICSFLGKTLGCTCDNVKCAENYYLPHVGSIPVEGIVERIRELRPRLPEAQRAIAELVLDDPARVSAMTILDLADTCQVSTGSITRFCRTLDLAGYAALRLALAADGSRSRHETWHANIGMDVTESDDIGTVAGAVSSAIRHTVAETMQRLDLAAVTAAAERLATARRVELSGVGGSSVIAWEFQKRLYRIGVPAWASFDAHGALTGAALLGPDDVVVAISHSGRTKEANDLVAEAVSRGALIVAITNDPRSALARGAELALITSVRAEGLRTETVLARHAQLAVVDVLYIAVAQHAFDQTTHAMAATTEAVRPYKEHRRDPAQRR